ncbi:MAG: T9SS type A sorting domain-containing protein [Bacteroidota bacterium]|nr:T9SS type A sorting domain-containing protein [Bacteroidota bacterium]MDP4234029.1 T9SS type A sorting domain-containing protein [Bacteroidota bacterium]MDP4242895.1 T9SS type A sorting domain-containing protein [Bacteroidota bacterium]MDP4287666.1 T9SS type A sorting domain-containing protein [Bacteroidota bacterium]
MKSIFVLLTLVLVSSASAQQITSSGRVSAEAFRTEVEKVVASYPNGEERYREVDNFRRLIQVVAAHKLGLTRDDLRAMVLGTNGRRVLRPTGFSRVSDISPDTCDENEASVAISRTNPNIIVAGANDLYAMYDSSMPAFVSTNGGRSWNTYYLPMVQDKAAQAFGDPYLTADDQGNFYYAFLISSQNVNPNSYISDLMVARSTDGIHWTLGAPVVGNVTHVSGDEDKETIAADCDPASPHYGRVYIAWRYTGYPNKYQVAYSDNHGMTWSKPVSRLSKYGYFEQIRVGKGGTVFIATNSRTIDYSNFDNDTGMHGIMVSHDGGQTFQEHYIASYLNYPPPSGNTYPNALKNGFKAYAYTSFDVDPATNKLYVVYGDYVSTGSSGYAVQYAVTSTDEGVNWSAPQQIGNPDYLESDHFQPWVTYDASIGKARVSMYSSEEDLASNQMTRMVRFDFDGVNGSGLTMPEPLGSDLFDPNTVTNPWGGSFIGDYTGGDAYSGIYAAVWTENDASGAGGGDIYAYVSNAKAGVTRAINAREFSVSEPFPNPATSGAVTIRISTNAEASALIRLIDLNGQEVVAQQRKLSPGVESAIDLDLQNLSAGVYRALISSDGQTIEKSIVVLR